MATNVGGYLLCLTSFDHLTYHATTRKSIVRRDVHFKLSAFVTVLLEINQILDRLITQLVRYMIKQLFTSVSVKVTEIYIVAKRRLRLMEYLTITH